MLLDMNKNIIRWDKVNPDILKLYSIHEDQFTLAPADPDCKVFKNYIPFVPIMRLRDFLEYHKILQRFSDEFNHYYSEKFKYWESNYRKNFYVVSGAFPWLKEWKFWSEIDKLWRQQFLNRIYISELQNRHNFYCLNKKHIIKEVENNLYEKYIDKV